MKTIQLISKGLAVSLFLFLVLFISAGRINYWQGWLYVSMNLNMTLMTVLASMGNTELMSERIKPGEGTKNWDKILLGISAAIYLIMIIVSGLDSGRFHWSPNLHWGLYIPAIILTLLGHLIFLIAKMQNKFFSSVVRIQTKRGHTVCETSLYKIIRHPGYFGMIISTLGFPLLLGSLWSLIPVILTISILVIRTYLEDKTLINEMTAIESILTKPHIS